MKILLLSHYYDPEIGAPQRRWRKLVAGMTAAGHRVAVAVPAAHSPYRPPADLGLPQQRKMAWYTGEYGERILRLPYLPTAGSMPGQVLDECWSSLVALRVAAALRNNRPDVVISTTPGLPMLFGGGVAAGLLGVPHVAEIRDAWPDLIDDLSLVSQAANGLLPARLSKFLEGRALPEMIHNAQRRAAHVVVTTDGFRERLHSAGISHVTTIRNMAVPNRHGRHPRYRGPRDSLRLLYVGTVGRSQNLELLVNVVSRLDGIDLTIVGGGVERARLRERARQLSLTSSSRTPSVIRFLPQTTGKALEDLFVWADCGVVSLADVPAFSYTVPSKLYNLMARGLFILGILSGEAADILTATRCGVVVPPGDARALRAHLIALRDKKIDLVPARMAQDWLNENASPERALGSYLDVLESVT